MGRTFTNLHMRRTEMKTAGTLCGGSESPLWAISLRSVGPGEIKELLADQHPCRRCVKVFNAEDPAPKNRLGVEEVKSGRAKANKAAKKATAKKTAATVAKKIKKVAAKKSTKPATSKSKPVTKAKAKAKAKAKDETKSANLAKPTKKSTAKSKTKVRPRTARERTRPKTLLAPDTSTPVAGIDIATSAITAAAA